MADQELPEEDVEGLARILCRRVGYDPDHLEPGGCCFQTWMDEEKANNADYDDLFDDGKIKPDGNNGKDDCHFMWRQYIWDAQAALRFRMTVTNGMLERAHTAYLEDFPEMNTKDCMVRALNAALRND